jgi:hypothetical protein
MKILNGQKVPDFLSHTMKEGIQALKVENPKKEIVYNPFSYITVSWLSSLLFTGAKRTLAEKDLYQLPRQHQSKGLESTLEPFWREFRTTKQSSLAKHLWNRFWWRMYLGFI